MSDSLREGCPDWRSRAEDRDRSADGEARWRLALEHAALCGECRERVLELDPSALFALTSMNLDATAESEAEDAAEVEAMLRAVTTVRRHRAELGPSSGRRWPLRAAVAGLLLAMTFVMAPLGLKEPDGDASPAAEVAREAGVDIGALLDEVSLAGIAPVASEPVSLGPVTVGAALVALDGADGATGEADGLTQPSTPRVYQWHDRDLSVVMIVDEALDV